MDHPRRFVVAPHLQPGGDVPLPEGLLPEQFPRGLRALAALAHRVRFGMHSAALD